MEALLLRARSRTSSVICTGAVIVSLFSGCSEPRHGFDAFFEEVGQIRLEESAIDPIVGIRQVTRRPDGGLALADERSGRVRLFRPDGRQERVLGALGEGPGEFRSPTASVELADGRVVVTDGADPTLTIFEPDGSVRRSRIPGLYGFWVDQIGSAIVAGIGSRGNRFAILDSAGDSISTFGAVRPEINEIPFWIFFARERATVAGDRILIGTSLYPTLRVFDANGDSIRTIGSPPPFWIQAAEPPIDRLADATDRERIAEWSRGFTVISDLATIADTLVIVQYGSYDPTPGEPYRIQPAAIDVYTPAGEKLVEGLALTRPILGGGRELLVLGAEPPDPWTITVYRWRGQQ